MLADLLFVMISLASLSLVTKSTGTFLVGLHLVRVEVNGFLLLLFLLEMSAAYDIGHAQPRQSSVN